jgi:hypothetical protein
MARIIQILGWAFILLGIMVAGLLGIMAIGGPPPTDPAGAVWAKLHGFSLGQFQVLVQRILGLPDLWDNYLVPVLKAPAWQPMSAIIATSFILGVLLLYSASGRRRAGIIHENRVLKRRR